jgi:hypothetical protein
MAAVNSIARSVSRQNMTQKARPVPTQNTGETLEQIDCSGSAQLITFPRAPIADMDTFRLTERVSGALNEHVAYKRNPDSIIAEAADANLSSAKNWRQKRCVPNALQFLRLAAQIPEVRALVRELLAMDTDMDPMIEQKISELYQTVVKRGA